MNKEEKALRALIVMDKEKKCPFCKCKFPEGILNKFPKQRKPLMSFLKGDFLFHIQSTHGYFPETFLSFFLPENK